MSSRRTVAVSGIVVIALVVLAFAIAFQGAGRTATSDTPQIVDVIVLGSEARRTLQVRDPVAITVLLDLLKANAQATRRPSGRPSFEFFVHPVGQASYTYSPSPIWQIGTDRFVAEQDGQFLQTDGRFADFVTWLRIRRVNQLLRSPNLRERQVTEAVRNSTRAKSGKVLLRIATGTNSWFAQAAIRELPDLMSAKSPSAAVFTPGEMHEPRRRGAVDPDRTVLDGLLELVAACPHETHTDPYAVGESALRCLEILGDRATANGLADLLTKKRGGRLASTLLSTLETLYGIPQTYERLVICGNSSPEELAQAAEKGAERQAAAIDDLLQWLDEHREAAQEDYFDAVVARWTEVLVHHAKTPIRSYNSDATPAPQLSNLLGQGAAIVPALQRRIDQSEDAYEQAMLEFCVAFLTGESEESLVKELMAGSFSKRRIACSIIATTGHGEWSNDLVQLMWTPIPDQGVEDVVALRDVAAQALFRSQGADALPTLRQAARAGRESNMSRAILSRFDIPVSQIGAVQ